MTTNSGACVIEEIEDPVEQMIKKTGCAEFHEAVQECIAETQDWRRCQSQLKEFRLCMEKNQRKTAAKNAA